MSADAALLSQSLLPGRTQHPTLTLSAAASLPHKALTGLPAPTVLPPPPPLTPPLAPTHTGCSLPTLWQLLEARLPLDGVSVLLPVLKQHLWQQLRTDPSLILTTEELQAAAK